MTISAGNLVWNYSENRISFKKEIAIFSIFLLRLRVTQKALQLLVFFFSTFLALFLDELAKVIFIFFSKFCFFSACDQVRIYSYDMACAFNLCLLEKNSGGGLK